MGIHGTDGGHVGVGTGVVTSDGSRCVVIELDDGASQLAAHMTVDRALEVAADLLTHANEVRRASEPSEEDKIRDAMTEAMEHPGRLITR